MRRTVLVWGICLMASAALAQPPGGGGGPRPTVMGATHHGVLTDMAAQ